MDNHPDNISELRMILEHGTRKEKIDVMRLLGEAHDAQSFNIIATYLEDEDYTLQDAALRALPKLDPERAPELIFPFFMVSNEALRRCALVTLEYTAPNTQIVQLVQSMLELDARTVVFALDVIGVYGTRNDIELIQPMLDNSSYKIRASAIVAILKLTKGNIAIEFLLPRLNDANAIVRHITCGYLGNYGGIQHIPYLKERYIDSDEEVRQIAAQAVFLIENRALS